MQRRPMPTHSSEAIEDLAELRERLAELRNRYQGRSTYRDIAKATGELSYTTVFDVLQCKRVPTWDSLKIVVRTLGGDPVSFIELYRRIKRQDDRSVAADHQPAEEGPAHIRVASTAWSGLLERDGVSEGLLRGIPADQISPDLAPLDAFVRHSLPAIDIDVDTGYPSRTFRIDSVEHFWIIMLVDSILHDAPVGLQRWLLRETDAILHREQQFKHHLADVWRWLFEMQMEAADNATIATSVEMVIAEAISESAGDHNRLYRTFAFFLDILKDAPEVVRVVKEALERHDDSVRRTGGGPAMLGRIRALIATAEHTLYGRNRSAIAFKPDLVSIPSDKICDYDFQVMRFPLTVANVDAILRRRSEQGLVKPFVLTHERDGDSPFRGLWKELTHILSSLPRQAGDETWRWDIPTVAEWITFAGCADQRYPWGNEPPTPERANIRFDATTRLSPVGTYVAGKSPHGVYDCCGGVHELVRELPHQQFESDEKFAGAFRLAGGSYLSPPQAVDCQRFRHLTERSRGSRPSTVGLRLVAYRDADEARRWASLRAFRLSRQERTARTA